LFIVTKTSSVCYHTKKIPKRYIYNSFIYKKRFIITNKKIRKFVVIKIKKKAGEGPNAPGGGTNDDNRR